MRVGLLAGIVVGFLGCSESRVVVPPGSRDGGAGADGGAADAGPGPDSGASPDAGASGDNGYGLLPRLAGLWSGAARLTVLGDFPIMSMDIRAASDRVLFGRVDLDPDNSLRFAFFVETIDGQDRLVFRNGGEFTGMTRDTRTVLESADEASGRYRFCALAAAGGCAYVDATFSASAPDRLLLHVLVRGQEHLTWDARRQETRTLPSPFPALPASIGTGSAPFPPLPELVANVSWTSPLAAPAPVWVLLSDQPCAVGSACALSRWIKVDAASGATSARLVFEQIHPGTYRATALIDRNANLGTSLSPDRGDGISNPNATVTVPASGSGTATLPILLDL